MTGVQQGAVMGVEFAERPWGSWHVIDVADGYKIKRIHVAPGCRLSLQTHERRSEHWVVIQGEATCTVDDRVVTVPTGSSIDVPQGARHRLANDSADVELVIVEVQLGGYTGEDDICRLQDDYGRQQEV
jgi:mannose-6-phosphate isomerase-like protein (cupin superfamily)